MMCRFNEYAGFTWFSCHAGFVRLLLDGCYGPFTSNSATQQRHAEHCVAARALSRQGTWWGNIVLPHLARWRGESVASKQRLVWESAKGFHVSKRSNEWAITSTMTPYIRQIIICLLKWNIKTWKKCAGWGNTAFCSKYDGVPFMKGCRNTAATDRIVDTCCNSSVLLSSATKHFFRIASHWLSIYDISHNHLVQQLS